VPTTWSIPQPEVLEAQRVTLTLGLSAAQRFYREVAVPGIGGATFVRHCAWAVAALGKDRNSNRMSPSMAPKTGLTKHAYPQSPI